MPETEGYVHYRKTLLVTFHGSRFGVAVAYFSKPLSTSFSAFSAFLKGLGDYIIFHYVYCVQGV